jgi:outer membrane protein assembly factor BamB
LILNAIEECGKIFSISKKDGEIQWEFEAETKLAYATPNLVTAADGELELVIPVPNRVIGLDPETGKQKWYVTNQFDNESNASVIIDNDIVYIYGGFRSVGSMAIRVGGQGDVTQSHVLWNTRDTSYVSTPILKDGHLYWIDESGIAFCVKAESGEQVYKKRVPGVRGGRGIKFFASMISAGDHMFAVSRRSGTFVIKTTPEYELVSQNQIAGDESEFNGTPAISGNQLFIRSNKFLYCIGE